jgi:tripartite-type tricarboxylate transporter receptor subunit TctC
MIRQLLVRTCFAVLLVYVPVTLHAQSYPNRAVRVVVTFAAGGSADLVARAVNQPLSTALGQPVVIDNRPGAGGTLGAHLVAQSEPDGYTLLFSATGPNAIAPGLQKNLPYDPVKSFAGISRISIQPAIKCPRATCTS